MRLYFSITYMIKNQSREFLFSLNEQYTTLYAPALRFLHPYDIYYKSYDILCGNL